MRLGIIDTYKGLPKSIYVIFCATVINRFGDFVIPFLTIYLTSKIGLSTAIAGGIVTLSALVGIPASIISGKLADEIGRKKVYLFSQFMAALFLLPCAFTENHVIIIISILISTFFNRAVSSPLDAIIMDILPPEKRQQGFSLKYLGINIGVAVGPIVAGVLFNKHLPLLFIGDALTSLAAMLMVWKYVDEVNPEKMKESAYTEDEKEDKGSTISILLKRPQILMFMALSIAYSFVYSQYSFSLPLTLESVFATESSKVFGILMSVNAFTVILCTAVTTAVTRRNKPIINTALAGIAYAVGFGMIGIIHSYSMFIISTVIWTIGEILSVTNNGVYLANNSPSNYRARINAANSLSHALGSALSSTVAGMLIQNIGLKYIWPLAFIIAAAGAVGMFGISVYENRRKTAAG